jgi:hypothetical protein
VRESPTLRTTAAPLLAFAASRSAKLRHHRHQHSASLALPMTLQTMLTIPQTLTL